MVKYEIHTYGSCNKPSYSTPIGAYGCSIRYLGNNHVTKLSGSLEGTVTSQRAEMVAIIKSLEFLDIPTTEVVLYITNKNLVDTVNKRWKRRSNKDLWERINQLCSKHDVTWEWRKNHKAKPGDDTNRARARKALREQHKKVLTNIKNNGF